MLGTQLAQAEPSTQLVHVRAQDRWLRGLQARERRQLTVLLSGGRLPWQPWASLSVHLRGRALRVRERVRACARGLSPPVCVPDSARARAPHTLLAPAAQVQPCWQKR